MLSIYYPSTVLNHRQDLLGIKTQQWMIMQLRSAIYFNLLLLILHMIVNDFGIMLKSTASYFNMSLTIVHFVNSRLVLSISQRLFETRFLWSSEKYIKIELTKTRGKYRHDILVHGVTLLLCLLVRPLSGYHLLLKLQKRF